MYTLSPGPLVSVGIVLNMAPFLFFCILFFSLLCANLFLTYLAFAEKVFQVVFECIHTLHLVFKLIEIFKEY